MISIEQFHGACAAIRKVPDEEKRAAIDEPAQKALFVVAGPGTGKTTCIVLRVLKLVFVDGIAPSGILATTFTKKAAAELRSRVLGWGYRMQEVLTQDSGLAAHDREWVGRRDLNRILTGTVDSMCESILRDFREAGTQPPVLVDEFVSKTILLRAGLLAEERYRDPDLEMFLQEASASSNWGFTVGRKNDVLQTIWDRRFQDQVNWAEFMKSGGRRGRMARKVLDAALEAYRAELSDRQVVDFAMLEHEVWRRLKAGQLGEFTRQLQVVLVDEYQDTNLLQEAIYFELARACGGALVIVGDDDQSLYRFRGATIALFRDFARRYRKAFKAPPKTVFLKTNYRSTKNIVSFTNRYVTLDTDFQSQRVSEKPPLVTPARAASGLPALALFRDEPDELAADLAKLIRGVFRGSGYRLPSGELIKAASGGGDVGDCALLCSSPLERTSMGRERLPLLLRRALRDVVQPSKRIEVFNPRGQELTAVRQVQQLGGLLLESLDQKGLVTDREDARLPDDVLIEFSAWRGAARELLHRRDLTKYVLGWGRRSAPPGHVWPRSVPALELLYGLVHFFPELHDDPEGQMYLEVFTRQLAACQMVGTYGGDVITGKDEDERPWRSVRELLRDFLGPIASGSVKVNEELMDLFPRDRLSILSIHQAKGLEFPFVIVDVGSDFKTNHAKQRFKRFPDEGSAPHAMEDLLWPHTRLGAPDRTPRDRAFDDLYRQYFVAFSRPQQALLLVGLTPSLPGGRILNVATGYRRTGSCGWQPRPFVQI